MKKWKQRELLFDRYVTNNQGGFSRRENVTYVNPEIPEEEAKYPSFTVQYTGKKDVNRVKIFEADIIQCYWKGDFREGYSYALVVYNLSSFSLISAPVKHAPNMSSKLDHYSPEYIKITGNFFQNPELVEKYNLEI